MSGRPLSGVEVGVVGTINRDEIVRPGGERTSSLGGTPRFTSRCLATLNTQRWLSGSSASL